MIRAVGIEKSFGGLRVLKGIDFEAKKSEVVSIVGASGAGKSTFLQIISSLMQPDSGKVYINDTDLFSLDSNSMSRFRNKEIGFVFQAHHLLPEFSAIENVMIPSLIAKEKPKDEIRANARLLLSDLGLGERENHKPAELSGGEQQRVAIARSIINNPKILFADEPSGNLDSHTKEDIHKLFFDLRDKYGQTIIIVTHDRDLAQMSDRMLEMKDGLFL